MTAHKAGKVIGADKTHKFARKHGVKIIPTRWVIGPKMVNGKEGDYPIAKACVCLQELLCPGVHDPGSKEHWVEAMPS